VKAKAVALAKEGGVSKRAIERALAKDKGKKPRARPMPLAGAREAFYAHLALMTPAEWKGELRDLWERLEGEAF
jgi:hypothetical protein